MEDHNEERLWENSGVGSGRRNPCREELGVAAARTAADDYNQ